MSTYKTFPLFQINASGYLVPVRNPEAVELWSTGAGAAKLKDLNDGITNNNDGTYQVEISDLPTGVYQIKVDFGSGLTEPDELNNIRIEGYDTLVQGDVDDNSLEYDGDLHIKADGVKKEHINADVAGTGLKQNVDGSLEADIDDAAGNGDTDKLWSADKIYDQLALKENAANIGDRKYSDNNLLTDEETITASLDKLDKAFGTMDWSEDSLLGTIYKIRKQAGYSTPVLDFTNAITVMAHQIMANLRAITAGTEELNRRVIFSLFPYAGTGAGDTAGSDTVWQETSTSYKMKINGHFYPRTGDKYIKIFFQAKMDSDSGLVTYNDLVNAVETEIDSTQTSYEDGSITIDISDTSQYPIGKRHFFGLYLSVVGGTGTIYMRYVVVQIEGAS